MDDSSVVEVITLYQRPKVTANLLQVRILSDA